MLTFFEYIHFFQLHFALIYFPETYRCCGAEIGDHHLGYFIWTDHANLKHKNAVPKSCCIRNRLNKLVSLRYWFLIFVLQVINIIQMRMGLIIIPTCYYFFIRNDENCGSDIFKTNLRRLDGNEFIRSIASKIYLNGCISTVKIILGVIKIILFAGIL